MQLLTQFLLYGMAAIITFGMIRRGFEDYTYWVACGLAWALIMGSVGLGRFLGNRSVPAGEQRTPQQVLREALRVNELTQKVRAGQATDEERQELDRLLSRPLGQ